MSGDLEKVKKAQRVVVKTWKVAFREQKNISKVSILNGECAKFLQNEVKDSGFSSLSDKAKLRLEEVNVFQVFAILELRLKQFVVKVLQFQTLQHYLWSLLLREANLCLEDACYTAY